MIDDELIQIWQSSPNHERIKFEKSKLMLEVQNRLDTFNKGIKRRDWLEIGAGIVMIPVFAFQVYNQPSLLAKIGAFWIVIYILFVIYKLRKAKKFEPMPRGSYLEYLEKNKNYLEAQKQLLDSVLVWYILPGLTGFAIAMIGILDLFEKPLATILNTKMVWVAISAMIITGVSVYFLNKWVVRKEIRPRIEKVDHLLGLLSEEESNV